MQASDVTKILQEARVDPMYYNIGEERHESLCLTEESNGWHVFLSERGVRYEERRFTVEDEACVYFLERVFQLWRPR